MVDNYIDILLKTPLFYSFDEETLSGMKDCLGMEIYQYEKGAFIINNGQPFNNVGIIVEGEATIIKENALGNRNIIELLGVGKVFGEMAAFSKKAEWYFSVQALQSCKVIFIPKERIIGQCASLCVCHKQLIENFLSIISERGIFLDKKIDYLSIKSVIGKLSAYLYDQYLLTNKNAFEIELNRNELSDFLNVSRPTLSREMAVLKKKEVIDYYRNTFKIMNVEALKELSIL